MNGQALAPNGLSRLLYSPRLTWGAYGLTAVALAGAAYLLWAGRVADAAILAGLVTAAVVVARMRAGLPPLFTLLFATVAAINAAGYVFHLWETPWWFDEFVHVVTPFVLIAAVGWVLIARNELDPAANTAGYFIRVVLLGLLVGFAWEGFEYVIGIVGYRRDTVIDLAMDALGALLAAGFCLYAARAPRERSR